MAGRLERLFDVLRNRDMNVVSRWAEAEVVPGEVRKWLRYYPGQLIFGMGVDWSEVRRQQDLWLRMNSLQDSGAKLFEWDVDNQGNLIPHPQDDMGMVSVWWDVEGKRVRIVIDDSVVNDKVRRKVMARLEKEIKVVAGKMFGWKVGNFEIES